MVIYKKYLLSSFSILGLLISSFSLLGQAKPSSSIGLYKTNNFSLALNSNLKKVQADELVPKFYEALESGNLLSPKGYAAFDIYKKYINSTDRNEKRRLKMRRKLVTAMMIKADEVLFQYYYKESALLWDDQTIPLYNYFKLSADLLGKDHPMYKNIKAKAYFIKAILVLNSKEKSSLEKDNQVLELLTTAKSFEPYASYIRNELGLVQMRMGYFNEALESWKMAIVIAPKWDCPHKNIGLAYAETINNKEALLNLNSAIKLSPQKAENFMCRGNTYFKKGEYKTARQDYETALSLDNNLKPTLQSKFILIDQLLSRQMTPDK